MTSRVLFLEHEETDYLAAQVYFALSSELGPENVVYFCFDGP